MCYDSVYIFIKLVGYIVCEQFEHAYVQIIKATFTGEWERVINQ